MTQTEHLLAALRSGGVVTPKDALQMWGCFRLAARISDARKLLDPDEDILSERVTVSPGVSVARYRLVRRQPMQAALGL